jgi:hypothetical protein
LKEDKSLHLRAFIVWEPVLPTDWGSPTSWTLFRVNDTRAEQFWDRPRLLQTKWGKPRLFAEPNSKNEIEFDMGNVIWDFVAVYPPGADRPSFSGGPLYAIIDEVQRELRRAEGLITLPPR